jgi:hypothetical protein
MSDSTRARSGGGCFSKLLMLILLAAAGGLGSAIYFALQPQDLSDLANPGAAVSAGPNRDLKAVLQSAIDRGYKLTLSEAEINQWLERTLVTKQGGFLEGKVTLDRVWVRLEEGRAEVIMARKFLGKPFTVSMFLQVERIEGLQGTATEIQLHGGPFHPDVPNPPRGGRFGKLVIPQGFLILVMPAYEKLAALFSEEIRLAFREMARIRLEKGAIALDPREPLGDQGMPKPF